MTAEALIGALTAIEARVLGSLIEKDLATPEYYPLSFNALTLACNQKTSREPVMSLDERDVREAVEELAEKGLVEQHRDSRAVKVSHRLGQRLNLGRGELALLGILLLRGAQTPGELKDHTARLHSFDDPGSAVSALRRLPEGFVAEIRQPGWKEARWIHRLCAEGEMVAMPSAGSTAAPERDDRLTRLEEELGRLRADFEEFRRRFD